MGEGGKGMGEGGELIGGGGGEAAVMRCEKELAAFCAPHECPSTPDLFQAFVCDSPATEGFEEVKELTSACGTRVLRTINGADATWISFLYDEADRLVAVAVAARIRGCLV